MNLKAILILLVIASSYRQVIFRVGQILHASSFIMYCALFFFLLAALLASSRIKSTPLRCLWGALFFLSYVLNDSFYAITGDFFNYSSFIMLVESAGFMSEAVTQYVNPLAVSVAKGLVLLAGIVIKPRPEKLPFRLSSGVVQSVAPIAGIALLSVAMIGRGGYGSGGLPGAFPPLSFGSLLIYENLTRGSKERRGVDLPRRTINTGRDIVLIIDESIRGDYLDINSPAGVHSGLKDPPGSLSVLNYGLAAAISNGSPGSNACLRYGGTREDYVTYIESMPSIWQYAKRAGYTTVYIDAQRTGGKLQNLMTRVERRSIDRFIQFDDVPIVQRDMAVADVLAELNQNSTMDLVVANKVGAHFPISDKYPDEFSVFKPETPRGVSKYKDVTDMGLARSGFAGEWNLYKNSYKNTLLWNVGRFFDRVLKELDFKKAVVLYTSDHGQGFHERGNPGLSTHDSPNPMIEEGLVPLVVITDGAGGSAGLKENLEYNTNRASDYAIFPTLLILMGYDPAAVRQRYGPSLADPLDDPMTFNARFEARFGLKPLWVKIDPAKVVGPDSPGITRN